MIEKGVTCVVLKLYLAQASVPFLLSHISEAEAGLSLPYDDASGSPGVVMLLEQVTSQPQSLRVPI